ncbi:hypothetical protein [Metabacillus idriensis]|uniref:hypothetical protein n=1 Tax=Metabacillus idriensis TaxID=324768 RepID=UPI003D2B991D
MIKKGKYAIYKGKEYSIISARKDQVKLRSTDPLDIEYGFELSKMSLAKAYVKTVEKNELDDAYEIIPTTFYKGYHFGIIGFDEAKQEVILMTSNPEAWKKLNLETHAKYEFTVDVPLNELEIIEEKEPILGFGEK